MHLHGWEGASVPTNRITTKFNDAGPPSAQHGQGLARVAGRAAGARRVLGVIDCLDCQRVSEHELNKTRCVSVCQCVQSSRCAFMFSCGVVWGPFSRVPMIRSDRRAEGWASGL